ncbi:MAG: hypothetical protein DI622_01525 [Chryseobacterium sp.]|uniref:hypothetical protein n=1 Tax=Chryseobacterium sp. TaxID=1871047 RepID=UPI000DB77545|nr:hypothetical protein [Chryseobacterium sp.]MPS64243.1 hypothetical protein [Chryseobacterium sp.]PZU26133.1 MAG: hypothetical protein DI622_01525 [Chryseobacterium sp.]
MIYYSKREFRIWAYSVSHESLLLRSYLKLEDEEGYSDETSCNIDMEFLGVEFIDIKTSLNNIKISLIEKEDLPFVLQEKFSSYRGKVFELLSDQKKFYVVANSVLIGINKWIQEDRIFNYNLNLKHDQILITIPER